MLIITLFIMEKGGLLIWHGECMRSTECLLVVYDYAQVLAKHCNARKKDLFQPHMGRVAEATEDNINAVQNDNFSVSFPWLNRNKVPSDGDNAHPITGSANRYCLLDKFHEKIRRRRRKG